MSRMYNPFVAFLSSEVGFGYHLQTAAYPPSGSYSSRLRDGEPFVVNLLKELTLGNLHRVTGDLSVTASGPDAAWKGATKASCLPS